MSNINFRPATAQPYHISRCARWLTALGHFNNTITAYNYLVMLETHRPDIFRHYMDEYYRVHTFKTGYVVDETDINAFRSARGPYGEDIHMYYSK